MNTQEMLVKMLQENTGTHFLDSGGAYGRHWERNSKLPADVSYWNAREEITFKAHIYGDYLEFDVTLDLYHFLKKALEYDEEMDRLFQTWDRLHPDLTYEESIQSFIKAGKARHWRIDDYGIGYTYNEENNLSQDFVWYAVDLDGDAYTFIQIHNGCDARGGFTAPHLFSYDPDMLFDYGRYSLGCGEHYWDFESAGYSEGGNSEGRNMKLMDFEHIDYEDLDEEERAAFDQGGVQIVPEDQMTLIDGVRKFIPYSPDNKIIVKDDDAYCPICGGRLYAMAF